LHKGILEAEDVMFIFQVYQAYAASKWLPAFITLLAAFQTNVV